MAITDVSAGIGDRVIFMLQEFGFFRLVIPMLLIFALFYGVLMKTKVLGDPEANPTVKPILVIVSFAAAFIVVASTPVVEAINKLIPASSFILVATLMILMILTFVGFKTENYFGQAHKWQWIIVGFLLFIFAGIIDFSTGFKIPILHDIFLILMGKGLVISGDAVGLLIGLALVLGLPLIVMFYIVGGGGRRP